MEIKYGGLSWRGDRYASVDLDIEALIELKAVVEDRITDYARVKNFDGVKEEIGNWNELLEAIKEVTPEPIPEAEEEHEEK